MNIALDNTVRLLTPFEAMAASHLTFPALRALLHRCGTPEVAAIGAFRDERPVGLLLAAQPETEGPAQVASLFVEKASRGQGVGAALLSEAEEELARRGCGAVRLEYSTSMPTRKILEKLLRLCGWTTPRPRMLLCRADERAFEAPFINGPLFDRIVRKLPGAEVFPWEELRHAEKESLLTEQQSERPWFPAYLSPFQEEPALTRSLCLGLRVQGQVVGWLITHRVAPTILRYSWGFVHPDLARSGAWLLLLRAAGQKHLEMMPRGSQLITAVLLENREMARFVRSRLAPWLHSLSEVCETRKTLVPST